MELIASDGLSIEDQCRFAGHILTMLSSSATRGRSVGVASL